MRRLLGVLLILGGFLTGAHFVHRLASPVIYTDDFAEDYAAALAIRAGASPYATSASELVARYIPESAGITAGKTFIVPHPPLLPLLVLPLTFVPYSTARGVWLAFELACLVGLSGLLPTGSSWRVKLPLTAALLSWPPVVLELRYGQWALLMALLLVLAWRMRRWAPCAGVLLGTAVALKFFPVLLIGVFVIRREWRTVAWACIVAVACTVAPSLAAPSLLSAYCAGGLRTPAALVANVSNYSAVAATLRLEHANVAVALVSLVLGGTAFAIREHPNDDLAYAAAVVALTVIAPLVWPHYLCLLLWPFAVAWTQLPTARRLLFAAAALVSFPQPILSALAAALEPHSALLAALLLLVLPAGPLLLLYTLVKPSLAAARNSALRSGSTRGGTSAPRA